MKTGVWKNGKRIITGFWKYDYPSGRFVILINKKDRITGSDQREIVVSGDKPEWGNWKLLVELNNSEELTHA